MRTARVAIATVLLSVASPALANGESAMFIAPYLVLCTFQEPERYARTAKEIDFYDDMVKSSKGVDLACLQRRKPASREMCDAVTNPDLTKDPKGPERFLFDHFEDIRRASVFSDCGWPRLWKDPKFDTPLRVPITPR